MNFNNKDSEDTITWFDEEMSFETMREAHEWVYSGAYNEIGNLFDGYRTKDPKLAYALAFELVRLNTFNGFRQDICCDEQYVDKSIVYRVWVKNKTY